MGGHEVSLAHMRAEACRKLNARKVCQRSAYRLAQGAGLRLEGSRLQLERGQALIGWHGEKSFVQLRDEENVAEMQAINETLTHVWNGVNYLRPWNGPSNLRAPF